MTDLLLWAGFAVALYAIAMAVALATPRINPGQARSTAFQVVIGPLTLDLSPWTLDDAFRYRPNSAAAVVDGWGPGGQRLSFWLHLSLDMIFPIAYAVALSIAIASVVRPLAVNAAITNLVAALPFAAAASDWVENAGILLLIRRHTEQSLGLARVVWLASRTKWALLLLSVVVLVVGLAAELSRLAGRG